MLNRHDEPLSPGTAKQLDLLTEAESQKPIVPSLDGSRPPTNLAVVYG